MATLKIRICFKGLDNIMRVRTMKFPPTTIVFEACRLIQKRINQDGILTPQGNLNNFGLYVSEDDNTEGVWLDPGLTLDYYFPSKLDLVEYKQRIWFVKVRTMDDTVRTFQVNDTNTVGELILTISSRIGITNHEEYSLILEMSAEEKDNMLTLRRKQSIAKDETKLGEMRKKLHTEDDTNWLDHSKTLREQGVNEDNTLLLRRRLFFSDKTMDALDPIELNLLYSQTVDAILSGIHPVSQETATELASLQCQVQFGDYNKQKHKSGFLEKWIGFTEMDAKVNYTHICQELNTYGITLFLVKEMMKGKRKLVPRLLGINKESVVRVHEETKEILTSWRITNIRRWAVSPNSFILDFGERANSCYSVQTQEGNKIAALIKGYIDITIRKQKSTDHMGYDANYEEPVYEEIDHPGYASCSGIYEMLLPYEKRDDNVYSYLRPRHST
ncbi:hypothetical protein ACJMK2_024908 [Sinanodonta woodiana]|uniref:FERM domain-containing protein n=1 Tax=Sinanodonta woodiana TaxID=1069815 RepID=A0ABD3XEY1_SINWO